MLNLLMTLVTKHRINTELKFLYKKKSTLNQLLYNTHLDCANYWKEMWILIERSEHQKFQIMNDILYNKLNKKLEHLRHKKTQLTKLQASSTDSAFEKHFL
jgi:hypothetical protein